MTKDLIVFKAIFKQVFIQTRRYIFETVSGVITLLLFFLGLFYGAKALVGGSGANLGSTLEALVVGYMVWALAIFMYSSVSQ
ncbi:MAG: ABC transporter permease, partial [Actinomycetota bacterium]